MLDLSIVIVSYNTRDMLRDCLLSIAAATAGISSETWVVDNNSPDKSAEMVAAEFPDVHLIPNPENAGFTRANNQALRQSRSRHVVILNPDTECKPGSLATLVCYLDTHADVGAVGPKLLNTDGSLQPNGSRFPDPLLAFLVVSELRRPFKTAFERHSRMRDNFDIECELEVISGACMMVRGSTIEQVGILDEDFFMFYEEVEWCWRIKKAGWKVMYVPQAVIVHHWMGSVRQDSQAMTARLFESSDIYYRKTGTPLMRFANRAVMAYGLAKNNFIHAGVRVKRWLRGRMGAAR
jgi:GT2 family glycosyltransferase